MGKSFKLRNGLLLLSTEAPGGVYNATQLKKIAAICESDSAISKATEDQRLVIFAPPERAAIIAKDLKSVGLGVRHYQDGLHQPVSCVGELCGDHHQDAMGASMDLARALSGIVLTAAPLKIGINGCGRCCVPTHTLDISIVGEPQGYRISLGGRSEQLPELATFMAEGVPSQKLPDLLTKVVTLFKMLAQDGEKLQGLIERVGAKPFLEALAPYSQDGFGADEVKGDDILDMDEADVDPKVPQVSEETDLLVSAPRDGEDSSLVEEGIPRIDPHLENLDTGSGPTIDAHDLLEENQDHARIGLEPELLSEELPLSHPVDLLEDSSAASLPQNSQSSTAASLASVKDMTHGEQDDPIGPIEADFDAQAALSDHIDDEVFPEDKQEPMARSEYASVEEAVGIDPIPDLIPENEAMVDSVDMESTTKTDGPTTDSASPDEKFEYLDDDLDAEVIDGLDADALEAKLTASIAEEENLLPEPDENASSRAEAIGLVTGKTTRIENDPSQGFLDTPDDFSDLQIDDEPSLDSGLREINPQNPFDANTGKEARSSTSPSLSQDPGSTHDPKSEDHPSESSASKRKLSSGRDTTGGSGFALSGVGLTDEGRIALAFVSGASLILDPRSIGDGISKDFQFGGQKINITAVESGLNVEVDGVTIFLPIKAA